MQSWPIKRLPQIQWQGEANNGSAFNEGCMGAEACSCITFVMCRWPSWKAGARRHCQKALLTREVAITWLAQLGSQALLCNQTWSTSAIK